MLIKFIFKKIKLSVMEPYNTFFWVQAVWFFSFLSKPIHEKIKKKFLAH